MSTTNQALIFLIQNLFGLYIYIVLLRFLLQLAKANFYNPMSQLVVKATQPLLKPFRSIIPSIKGQDWAALILSFLLYALMIALIVLIVYKQYIDPLHLMIYALGGVLNSITTIYLFAIIISAIMSWIPSTQGHPMAQLLWQLIEPAVGPIRKLMPDMGGIDLSPLVVLLLIQLIRIFINPIAPF